MAVCITNHAHTTEKNIYISVTMLVHMHTVYILPHDSDFLVPTIFTI